LRVKGWGRQNMISQAHGFAVVAGDSRLHYVCTFPEPTHSEGDIVSVVVSLFRVAE